MFSARHTSTCITIMKKSLVLGAFFLTLSASTLLAQTPDERRTDPVNPPADTVYRNSSSDPERRLERNNRTDENRAAEAETNPTAPPRKNDEMLQKQKQATGNKGVEKQRRDSTARPRNTTTGPK